MSSTDTRFKPQRDEPLTAEAEHLRWLAASRKQFRRIVTLSLSTSAVAIGLMAFGTCGYVALFDRGADLRQDAAIPCMFALGALSGTVLIRSLG